MKFFKNTLFTFLIGICFASYGQNKNLIKFYQNDKLLPISSNKEISLKKQAFSLTYFYKKYIAESKSLYSLQISFFKNKEDMNQIKIGSTISDISNFRLGSAMVSPEDGFYDTMALGINIHNNLYYTSETESNVELLQNLRNDFEARWNINEYYDSDTSVLSKMSKLKYKTLYMVVFRDENLNKIIDEGEIETFTLSFF